MKLISWGKFYRNKLDGDKFAKEKFDRKNIDGGLSDANQFD